MNTSSSSTPTEPAPNTPTDWKARAEQTRQEQWDMAEELMLTARHLQLHLRVHPERAKASTASQLATLVHLAFQLRCQATGLDAQAAKPAGPTGPPPLTPEEQADLDAIYGPAQPVTPAAPQPAPSAPAPPVNSTVAAAPNPQPPSSGCAGDSAADPKKVSPSGNTPEAAGTAFNSQFAPHTPATPRPEPQPEPQSKIETQNSKISSTSSALPDEDGNVGSGVAENFRRMALIQRALRERANRPPK